LKKCGSGASRRFERRDRTARQAQDGPERNPMHLAERKSRAGKGRLGLKKTKMKRDIGDRLIRLHDAQLKFAVVAEFPVFLDRIGRDPSVGSSAEIGTYANATSFPIISLWLVMRRPISRHGGLG